MSHGATSCSLGGRGEREPGGGLNGGMRSGMGSDVSGAMGDSDDEAVAGDQQRSPRRRKKPDA